MNGCPIQSVNVDESQGNFFDNAKFIAFVPEANQGP